MVMAISSTGSAGKKFMKKNFRKLILDIQSYPDEQAEGDARRAPEELDGIITTDR
ncbi:MAG: hypothetical protein MZV63_08970 [Marinilabiliales bacterium]|nr:hypothetical protein [Marinilabiliales bacterium]